MLSERKLAVSRPRLHRKGPGPNKEIEVPAYTAMQDESRLGARMLDILMRDVSTRQYRNVNQEMADTVGVPKSSVSGVWWRLRKRRSRPSLSADDVTLVIIYIDGITFGDLS